VSSLSSRQRGWALLIGSNIIFAGAYVSGKFALGDISPVKLNFLRFIAASLLLLPVVLQHRKKLRMNRTDAITFITVSFCSFVLNKLFEYWGLSMSTATDGALLISGEGIFTALLAWLFLKESMSIAKVSALALGVCGVYLIVMRGPIPQFVSEGPLDRRIFGDMLFLFSLFFEAIASIASKRLSGQYSPLLVTSATVVGSLFVWIPLGGVDIAWSGLTLTTPVIGGTAYLVFMTVVGYYGWFAGLQLIEGSVAAATLFLQPMIGTILAILLLNEEPTIATLVGGCCIAGSVWWITRLSLGMSDVSKITGEVIPVEAP
jgi:drug/metabolite transporter (DMT)-like permease